jgi:hypothetical protein
LDSIEESSHKVRQGHNVTNLNMKNLYRRLVIALACIIAQSLAGQTPEAAAKPKQFYLCASSRTAFA